jgi:pimeloyl-ACP methyl ester carboxylesterase
MAVDINYVRRGSGEPLVLIHGIGSRWQMWSPVIDALAQHRDVIALDVPGFGASPRPPQGTKPGIPTMTDMLVEFWQSLGIDRPHVAGNSMGGWLALEMARRGVVRSATGLSPAGFHVAPERAFELASLVVTRTLAKAGRPLAPKAMRTPFGRKLTLSSLIGKPAQMQPDEAVLSVQGVADATWFWPTLGALCIDRFSGGEEINVPVTIAWGEHDHLLLPRQAPRALAEIPSARYVLLRDCGHVPAWDNPELVTKTILDGSTTA